MCTTTHAALPGQFWEVLFAMSPAQNTRMGWGGAGSGPGGCRACDPVGGLSAGDVLDRKKAHWLVPFLL